MKSSRLGKLALVTLGIGLVAASLLVAGSFVFLRSGNQSGQAPRADEGASLPDAQIGSRESPAGQRTHSSTNSPDPVPAPATAQFEHPEGAFRSRPEAIELAREAARTGGSDLGAYQEPQASFHTDARWSYWSVFFDGKAGGFGNHFSVRVDDLSGATRLVKGR